MFIVMPVIVVTVMPVFGHACVGVSPVMALLAIPVVAHVMLALETNLFCKFEGVRGSDHGGERGFKVWV